MNDERPVDIGDPDPHFDGRREGPITDPDGGPTMGIKSDIDSEHPLAKNPYHLSKTKDKEMERLNEVIGGKKVEE